jgi:hypothetical protein
MASDLLAGEGKTYFVAGRKEGGREHDGYGIPIMGR